MVRQRDTAVLEQTEHGIKTCDHKQVKNYRKLAEVPSFVKDTIRFQHCHIVTSTLNKE
jgi:hypothetical protein